MMPTYKKDHKEELAALLLRKVMEHVILSTHTAYTGHYTGPACVCERLVFHKPCLVIDQPSPSMAS